MPHMTSSTHHDGNEHDPNIDSQQDHKHAEYTHQCSENALRDAGFFKPFLSDLVSSTAQAVTTTMAEVLQLDVSLYDSMSILESKVISLSACANLFEFSVDPEEPVLISVSVGNDGLKIISFLFLNEPKMEERKATYQKFIGSYDVDPVQENPEGAGWIEEQRFDLNSQ